MVHDAVKRSQSPQGLRETCGREDSKVIDGRPLDSGDARRQGIIQRGRERRGDRGRARRVRVAAIASVLLLLAGCNTNSWGKTFGPSNSSRTRATWTGADDWVELAADRRSTQSGCTTVWFDWARNGHYDARAVRDCHASGSVHSKNKWSSEYPSVLRMQKLAACTTGVHPPSTSSGCLTHPNSEGDIGLFASFSNRSCISFRTRSGDGSSEYNPGGVKNECDA